MNSLTKFLGILSLILVAACDHIPTIQTEFVKQQIEIKSRPAPVTLSKVDFGAVSHANVDEFSKKIRLDKSVVIYTLTQNDYQNLILNINEMRRFVLESNSLIQYYEDSVTQNQ